MDVKIFFFEKKEGKKTLAHVQDFKDRSGLGSRKNSIPFRGDLFAFKLLLYVGNHWGRKEQLVVVSSLLGLTT